MSRFVVPSRPGLVEGRGEPPSGLVKRIVKYIPAELIGPFTLVISALAASSMPAGAPRWVAIGLIAAFGIATIIYFAVRTPAGSVRMAHMIVSPLAFLAWAYPISSPLLQEWFIGWVSIIVQVGVWLLAWIIAPSEPA